MKKHITLFFSVFTVFAVNAQEGTNTSGGEASGSGGTSAYSIGQTSYTTNSSSTGSASEGVQQPYEIYIVGIDYVDNTSIEMALYPNPTIDDITLRIDGEYSANVSYLLLDVNGRHLASDRINYIKTYIPTGKLSSGTYFLNITDQNQVIKTFKIIKN